MIFSFCVSNSRRRRWLKRTGAVAPVLTGAWGRQPPTSTRRVYTGALLATTYSATSIASLNFSLNHSNKFTGTYIKCVCYFPQSFKICLLVTVLNQR